MRTSLSVGLSCLLCLGLAASRPASAGERPIGDFSGTLPLIRNGECPPDDIPCETYETYEPCDICELAHDESEPCPEVTEFLDAPPAAAAPSPKAAKRGGNKYDGIGKDGGEKAPEKKPADKPKTPEKPAYQPPGPPPVEDLCPPAPSPEICDEEFAPTPEAIEAYRQKLERRLFDRYNNLPDYAGKVGKVSVVLSKPLDHSLDGKYIKAEFDQLVFDNWGKRLPALEKEYYVVTFGCNGTEQVRSDPSVRVGLDKEKVFSERAPLPADPFRKMEVPEAFKPAPSAPMPKWWRPEFPDSDCYDYY